MKSITQLLLAFVAAKMLSRLTRTKFFLNLLVSYNLSALAIHDIDKLRPRKKSKSHGHQRKSSGHSDSSGGSDGRVFDIPLSRLNEVILIQTPITSQRIDNIPYAEELEWIFDLAFMSILCYLLVECQFFFYSKDMNESNYSTLWILMVILFSYKILFQLTLLYHVTEHRNLLFGSWSCFFIVAFVFLSDEGEYFDLGMNEVYIALGDVVQSKLLVRLVLALLCSITGMLFNFPGFRYGQLYKSIQDDHELNQVSQVFCKYNYIMPVLVCALWFKPIIEGIPLEYETFVAVRIYMMLAGNFVRLHMLPKYLQAWLAGTRLRIHALKFEGLPVTNRKLVDICTSVISYTHIVAIQYLVPVLLCIFTTILHLHHSGFYLFPMQESLFASNGRQQKLAELAANSTMTTPDAVNQFPDLETKLVIIKSIFSAKVLSDLFAFSAFWMHLAWFLTSTSGLIYFATFTY